MNCKVVEMKSGYQAQTTHHFGMQLFNLLLHALKILLSSLLVHFSHTLKHKNLKSPCANPACKLVCKKEIKIICMLKQRPGLNVFENL